MWLCNWTTRSIIQWIGQSWSIRVLTWQNWVCIAIIVKQLCDGRLLNMWKVSCTSTSFLWFTNRRSSLGRQWMSWWSCSCGTTQWCWSRWIRSINVTGNAIWGQRWTWARYILSIWKSHLLANSIQTKLIQTYTKSVFRFRVGFVECNAI